MPNLNFVLPHWMYWGGLIALPIAAMYLVRRESRIGKGGGISLPTAYLLWLTGGFVGVHRFYLRNWWGLIFIPLFLGILWMNVETRAAREVNSRTHNELNVLQFDVDDAAKAVSEGKDGAAAKLEAAKSAMAAGQATYTKAQQDMATWRSRAGWFALAIAILLLIDAILLPKLTRAAAAKHGGRKPLAELSPVAEEPRGSTAPGAKVSNNVTKTVDRVNTVIAEFIGYWSLIAVFVYYYEVVARYVFNSPTNWAHEGMFLMFGMQYLLSGGYAFKEDAHVRVDIIYVLLPDRVKAILDVVTMVFFYLFNVVLFVTGMVFLKDATGVWEVSMTEWGIQYWAVKATIPIGAALLLLQGTVRMYKNIVFLRTKGA